MTPASTKFSKRGSLGLIAVSTKNIKSLFSFLSYFFADYCEFRAMSLLRSSKITSLLNFVPLNGTITIDKNHKNNQLMIGGRMFEVGEVAVYPGHGVGKIESIEEKEFSGMKQSFYIIRIMDTDMTIMIPVDGAKNAGLRCVIDSREVTKVLAILKEKNSIHDNAPWNRRYKEYMERIKSGSIFEVAMVLKELYSLRVWKELSFGEKKMFEIARNLIKKELSISLDKEEEEIEQEIERIFLKNYKE
jgi:CarD family transcriptional regulator